MENNKQTYGTISWTDITVQNAMELKSFYENLIGWTSQGIPMKNGDESYEDYVMKTPDGKVAAGICHLKGVNKSLPTAWIIYITVENLVDSLNKALVLGGKLIQKYENKEGKLMYAIIQDPPGAIFGIAEPYEA
jgi:predicted enzyme related to lactoylglutathione lyase